MLATIRLATVRAMRLNASSRLVLVAHPAAAAPAAFAALLARRFASRTAAVSQTKKSSATSSKGKSRAGTKAVDKKPTVAKKAVVKPKTATKKLANKKTKKTVAKKRVRAALTEKQKAAAEALKIRNSIKNLKNQALIKEKPKTLPRTAWTVFTGQQLSGSKGVNVTDQMHVLSEQYKGLSEADKQRLDETATRNDNLNRANYSAWVSSLDPKTVDDANRARRKLNRLGRGVLPQILDDRQPRRPPGAFILYNKFYIKEAGSTTSLGELAKEAARKWGSMSEAEQKPYKDEYTNLFQVYAEGKRSLLDRSVNT